MMIDVDEDAEADRSAALFGGDKVCSELPPLTFGTGEEMSSTAR